MTEAIRPWTASIEYEGDLDEDERQLRDAVVEQYLHDRSWTNACKRLGMKHSMAMEYAARFAQDSYVQMRLRKAEERLAMRPQKTKTDELVMEQERVIQALKDEAYYHGPGSSHAARVSALKQLCSVYGMDAPKQTKVDVGVQSGVMLVPSVNTNEEWEAAAKSAQEQLQKDTLDGLSPIH